jgi:hypothetical protein
MRFLYVSLKGGKRKMKKRLSVDISKLEQYSGVDLHEFKPGKMYPLSKLMDALGFMKPGRSKVTRGGDKN